ncbi:phosphoribosylamine--glycine ligase [Flaviaesturariibacter flavus]|uniref:Phosphoribosylamine--glycine ligase n=1 Tax=Flaviaesturariibacter flavus TaxID=2502780 RepID=A0A4R1BAT3_9BACT|nr:phosphoribosylamine--glycine ligase [Flaviaesturariibacter flavus]TCJ14064.1 phosphoribosylamine--glycine ligase [Flaviaesturariibacter flavus]
MNILLLGSGGREHAIAWKLRQSPLCDNLYIAPGNPGTAREGVNLPFAATDFDAVRAACVQHAIGLLVVGPEEPLVKGLVDTLRADAALAGLAIIGPAQEAAQLEGSKAYAKAFMARHGIPTAGYREFTRDNLEEGIAYVRQHPVPVVLKADGLAAGKGVLICQTNEEAATELEAMIAAAKFGAASAKVVVEEFLDGIELSVFALTDGKGYVLLPEAKDYKRIGEGDSGLNTGGMGAISPVPFADTAFMEKVRIKVVEPTVRGLEKDGLDYKGFVFFGLIKVDDEPFVIEYNCRMGDPETEVVLPRTSGDLASALLAVAEGRMADVVLGTDPRAAATIMAVSGGYPGDYAKGFAIDGLAARTGEGTMIFHAGTAERDSHIVTSGGRVLCATTLASTLGEAVAASKKALEGISFEGMYYRKDIGYEFL